MFEKFICIDLDFSENLSIPVQFEPQSLHWCHQQVCVHSGIVKANGDKTYHTYFSDDKKHDEKCMIEMLGDIYFNSNDSAAIIIHTENCSSQYKSSQHFHHLQDLSNAKNAKVIRVWSVSGHGKGEADHVGGIAKVTIKRDICNGNCKV